MQSLGTSSPAALHGPCSRHQSRPRQSTCQLVTGPSTHHSGLRAVSPSPSRPRFLQTSHSSSAHGASFRREIARWRHVRCQAEVDTNGVAGALPALFQPPGKEGLIFSKGPPAAWDSGGVGTAVVRRYQSDNEERWWMWYQGWREGATQGSGTEPSADSDSSEAGSEPQGAEGKPLVGGDSVSLTGLGLAGIAPASVGLALSSNGLHWSRGESRVETDARGDGGAGTVLEPNSNWWTFDTRHVSVSDVLIMSSEKVRASGGVYWMYYVGGDREDVAIPEEMARLGSRLGLGLDVVEGLRTRPGLAMSNDGRNWARIEGDHHSGALFDVGEEGDWDAIFIGAPQVVFHRAGDIRMYYHSFSRQTRRFTAGFARSRDGLKWVKFGKCIFGGGAAAEGGFDGMGVAARHVVPDPQGGEGYVMAYEGVAEDGSKSIGLAKSKDGLWDWERVGDGPVLERSRVEGAWDSESVGSPSLVDMGEGNWRLYYVGVGKDGQQGIGMAESTDSDLTSFRRWHSPAMSVGEGS